jgi:hypothetical protein
MADTPTEAELKELEQEMRKRTHDLANALQIHTSEIEVMKQLGNQVRDLLNAIYGDLKSGTDTGLRGAVAHLAQAVRDTELQRQQDRRREDAQYASMAQKLEAVAVDKNKRSGAMSLAREVTSLIATMATAGTLIVAIYQMTHK